MSKKNQDIRKRLSVALNLDTSLRERLHIICEIENRSPTQQIEYFLKHEISLWWQENEAKAESFIESPPLTPATARKRKST